MGKLHRTSNCDDCRHADLIFLHGLGGDASGTRGARGAILAIGQSGSARNSQRSVCGRSVIQRALLAGLGYFGYSIRLKRLRLHDVVT